MSPGNDERLRKGGESSSRLPGRRKPTRELHVWASVHTIRGSRGKDRVIIIVRCPFCSADHAHSGKVDFVQGKRRASCRLGRYVVLAGGQPTTYLMTADATHTFRAS